MNPERNVWIYRWGTPWVPTIGMCYDTDKSEWRSTGAYELRDVIGWVPKKSEEPIIYTKMRRVGSRLVWEEKT
jgi:hypothetical protein